MLLSPVDPVLHANEGVAYKGSFVEDLRSVFPLSMKSITARTLKFSYSHVPLFGIKQHYECVLMIDMKCWSNNVLFFEDLSLPLDLKVTQKEPAQIIIIIIFWGFKWEWVS